MTRRLFIYLLLLAFGSFGNPTRSNVGATHIAYGEHEEPQTYTASDYIQDDLIAMFDGIENVDVGVHNDDAIYWADLTGNHVLSYQFTGGCG